MQKQKTKKRENPDVIMTGNFACYCLWSTKMLHRVYTGQTNDFPRRLKEHNTSSRGARHTHEGRPYLPIFIVSGFYQRIDATQFERAMKKRRSCKFKRGIMGRVATLLHNLRDEKWKKKNLRVLCLFDKSYLDKVFKRGDEEITRNFVWKKIKIKI